MSAELLRLDRVPTLSELRFLLNLAQDRGTITDRADLGAVCQGHSVNLGRSYENGITILDAVSLVEHIDADGIRIKLDSKERELLHEDLTFCTMVTTRLIEKLHTSGLLGKIFNQDTVKFDIIKDTISLNVNLMPLEYPMMKTYLINMGIALPDWDIRSRILIQRDYKQFFVDEILRRVFNGSENLDIVTGEESRSETGAGPELPVNGVKVFVSYSRKDKGYEEELRIHFSGLKRRNVIKFWYDGLIIAGEEWDAAIKRNLEEANYIFFLISADFIHSDYINDVEIKRAIERHEQGKVKIIPIIARPCDHESLPLSKFQALPKGAKPIASWADRDEAYLDIVMEFKKLLSQ